MKRKEKINLFHITYIWNNLCFRVGEITQWLRELVAFSATGFSSQHLY